MKRRHFLVGTAGLATTAALAACGNTTNTPGSGSSSASLDANTEANLTLFYWDKAQSVTVDDHIKSFNDVYPKIKVTTSLASYADYWTKLRTQAEGDQMPDVFWMNGPNIQLYASNGMLAPLDDLEVDWTNYPQALVDLYSLDGQHYGVPKDYDTIGCWINKAVFADAGVEVPTKGWTWDEHHAAAKAIADKGNFHGALAGVSGGQETFYNTIAQAGGYVIRDGKSGYDDPKSVAGIQYLTDLIADGSVPSLQVMSDTAPHELFLSGKGGILWGGSWQSGPIREAFPDRSQIVAVPLPVGEKQASVIHGLSYVASAKSTNLDAAKALVQHMTSEEANKVEATNGTAIPAFVGTQGTWVDQVPEYNLNVFIEAADNYAVPYPVSKNTSAWNAIEPENLNKAFSGEVSVETACTALAAEMNKLLAAE